MTWFKVDDGLAFHPKALTAGNAALGLWVRAGAWSAAHLTEGLIPRSVIPSLGTIGQARALVAAGLWTAEDGGFRFHQWTERNPTRAEVEADRQAARDRMNAARARRRAPDNDPEPTPLFGRTTAERSAEHTPKFARSSGNPDPTRPDPTRSSSLALAMDVDVPGPAASTATGASS